MKVSNIIITLLKLDLSADARIGGDDGLLIAERTGPDGARCYEINKPEVITPLRAREDREEGESKARE